MIGFRLMQLKAKVGEIIIPPENPELLLNGTFNTDAANWSFGNGASLTVENGRLKLTKTTGSNPYMFQAVNLIGGKTYEFKGSVVEAANPTASIRIGTSAANLNIINSGSFGVNDWVARYSPANDIKIYYSVVHSSGTIGTFIVVDNLSIKEVT